MLRPRNCVTNPATREPSVTASALAEAGVDQLNLCLMNGNEEERQKKTYGREIVPALRDAQAANT
jgi:hypothetical protein